MKYLRVTLTGIFLALAAMLNAADYNPSTYGAGYNDTTLDTTAVQSAIDAASAAGGGRVLINGGTLRVGTIHMKDDVTLEVTAGSVLKGSENENDYVDCFRMMYEEGGNWNRAMIFADGVDNITFQGAGIVHGSGVYEGEGRTYTNRPVMFRIKDCDNVTIKDLSLIRPRAWTVSLLYSTNILVDNITIETMDWDNSGQDGIINGDGVDIDGCENVIVRNSTFSCHDDCVAIMTSRSEHPAKNIKIYNCDFLEMHWGGIRIGLMSVGDIEDVEVYDCEFFKSNDAPFKIQIAEGGQFSDMDFHDNIVHYGTLAYITLNSFRFSIYEKENNPAGMAPPFPTGPAFSNIKFRNTYIMETEKPNSPQYGRIASLQGTSERSIDGGISFEGIYYRALGQLETQAHADRRTIKEIGPAGTFRAETSSMFEITGGVFMPLPGYAITQQYAEDIVYSDCIYETSNLELRNHTVFINSSSGTYTNMYATGSADAPGLVTTSRANAAIGKTFTASSGSVSGLTDSNVAASAWSTSSNTGWLQVDMGQDYVIERVNIVWGTDAGKEYRIETSQDGTNWTDMYATTVGVPGILTVSSTTTLGRYIKFQGVQSSGSGYDIKELEVFGSPSSGQSAPVATIVAPTDNASFTPGSSISFQGTASDLDEGNITDVGRLEWISSLDGVIGSGLSFSSSSLSTGQHTITFTAEDITALTGTDTVTINIAVPPSGPQPVAWWKFDEGVNAATATDSSPNGLNGSVAGSTTTGATGKIGNAYNFSLATSSYVESDSSSSYLQLVTKDFSLAAWVNPASFDTGTKWRGIFGAWGGGVAFGFKGTALGITQIGVDEHIAAATVPTGSWSHVACSYDNGTDTLKLYVNGSIISTTSSFNASATDSGGNDVSTRPTYWIGKFYDNGNNTKPLNQTGAFDGLIDDAMIFNQVLTGAEILNIYNSANAAPDPYDTWSAANNYTGGDADPDADPDNDGIVNLIEYGFNLTPGVSNAAEMPMVTMNGANLVITHRKNTDATDTTFSYEASDDLSSWSPITPTLSTSAINASTDEVMATLDVSGEPKYFIRVKLIKP